MSWLFLIMYTYFHACYFALCIIIYAVHKIKYEYNFFNEPYIQHYV